MSAALKRALGLLGAIATAAAAFSTSGCQQTETRPQAQRPILLLLTSLPIVFGEEFSLEGTGSPALSALETRYRVVPISVTDKFELAKGRLLLMAQPGAQAPENLVVLDKWVRRGGRVMVLADPMLEWPSKRPLGDRLRPPIMFTDTGLLGHWGLRLDAPDERGPVERKLAGRNIVAISPGALLGKCEIADDRLVARCQLGKGQATVVADADILNGETDGSKRNLDALLTELATLEETR